MRSFFSLLALIIAVTTTLGSTSAQAQLILNVDPGTEMVWFTGDDTGNPEANDPFAGGGTIEFGLGASVSTSVDIKTGITATGNTLSGPFGAAPAILGPHGIRFYTSNSANTTTLTGNGTMFSYASFSTLDKTTLESHTSLALGKGTGFQAITVNNLSAVPEPTSFAMFGVAAAGLCSRRRRKSRS